MEDNDINVIEIKRPPRNNSGNQHRNQNQRRRPTQSGRRRRRRKNRRFKRFLMIYAAALLLILIVGGIIFTWFLSTLETSQSYNTAQEVTEEFNAGADSLTAYLTENSDKIGTLEADKASLISAYVSGINADEGSFSYVENSDYTEDAPSYDITKDGETVSKVTLTRTGSRAFGLARWEVAEVDIADYVADTITYEILVPAGSSVTVNETVLDESYATAQNEVPEVLANVTELISAAPTYDTYTISGFINEPSVSVTDTSGNALNVTLSGSTFVSGTLTSDEFIASVSDRVTSAIEAWGLYFINKGYNLSSYMLSGTQWYEYIFGSDTIDPIYTGFYGSQRISSYTFSELSATNYVQYTENCFTVEVSYKLDLTFSEEGYSDDDQKLDATWVWVNSGGTWYIADVIYE